MQAMILAAGFGTRLKPFTLIKPKPLFPVLTIPLLLATINRLKSSGFTSITVNCHHLGEQIIDEVASIDGVIIQEEVTILGTGGGLRQALGHIRDEPLLVTNGDIYHGFDFSRVYAHHQETGADVTMVLHDFARYNTVSIAGSCITGFHGQLRNHHRAYTGIQVINPDSLSSLKTGTFSCIIDHYRNMLAGGKNIHSFEPGNVYWSDMGTPGDYLQLHEVLLSGAMPIWPEFGVRPQNGCFFAERSVIGEECIFDDWACVGSAELGDRVHLSRSIVWDNARVASDSHIADRIVAANNSFSDGN